MSRTELPIDMESLDPRGANMTSEEWTPIAAKQYEDWLRQHPEIAKRLHIKI